MESKLLVTLGPSSFSKDIVRNIDDFNIYLFRINLSHTPLENVPKLIENIGKWTDTPICLDSEGAQIRNQKMESEKVYFEKGDMVKIHYDEVIGDSKNISFSPNNVVRLFEENDLIKVDFDSAAFRIKKINKKWCLAVVEHDGYVGSNKASDLDRIIKLDPLTDKDKKAFRIGKEMGLRNFSLSFTNSGRDVELLREIVGTDANIISKIESIEGIMNLDDILSSVNEILIDRGDLSRQVRIEKIPLLQRRIISHCRSRETPVYVATNLLESMVATRNPTRAEVNDVISTLLMGANGLVLAGETATGRDGPGGPGQRRGALSPDRRFEGAA